MRTITTTITVYTYGELSDQAKKTAIGQLCEMQVSGWDSHDTDQIRDAMVYTLAEQLRTPGWDTEGPAGFEIPGITVSEWDLDRRAFLALAGRLDRDNAPALPWVDAVDSVSLVAGRNGTTPEVILNCTCSGHSHEEDCPTVVGLPITEQQITALEAAISDAINEALHAGVKEHDWLTGEEYARERTDHFEFTNEGYLYP